MDNYNDGFAPEDFQFAKREIEQVDRVFSGDSYIKTVIKRENVYKTKRWTYSVSFGGEL